MSRRETILNVQMMTDDDTGMYRIGEIDTLPDDAVAKYVQRFGEYGYQEILTFAAQMTSAALIAYRKFNEQNNPSETSKQ